MDDWAVYEQPFLESSADETSSFPEALRFNSNLSMTIRRCQIDQSPGFLLGFEVEVDDVFSHGSVSVAQGGSWLLGDRPFLLFP